MKTRNNSFLKNSPLEIVRKILEKYLLQWGTY